MDITEFIAKTKNAQKASSSLEDYDLAWVKVILADLCCECKICFTDYTNLFKSLTGEN